MLGTNAGMCSLNRLFQVTPEAFNRVHGRAIKADILASAVIDRHVPVALVVQSLVAVEFVGVQFATGQDVGRHERPQRHPAQIPATPRPLSDAPMPDSVSAALDVALSKLAEWAGFGLKAAPLMANCSR